MGTEPEGGMGSYWQLGEVLDQLGAVRDRWRAAHPRNREHGSATFPARRTLEEVMQILCGVLFPLRLGPSYVRADNEGAYVAETLENGLSHLYGQIRRELGYSAATGGPTEATDAEARRIIGAVAPALPAIRETLDQDVEAAFANDPAARSVDEVLLCYPSLLAIIHHRLAARLHRLGAPLVARIIGEIAHAATGIDIHPGATIGSRFFIDHGTGVVIGETAVIGDRVRLHQSVTLGGPSGVLEESRGRPRHPIIEDDVIVYAGATLLGCITVGARSVIGGNLWLTRSVPPDSHLEQAPPVAA
jgi:serine O-acetyltransferase